MTSRSRSAAARALAGAACLDTVRLNHAVAHVDSALEDEKTRGSVERRLLGANCHESVDAVVQRYKNMKAART